MFGLRTHWCLSAWYLILQISLKGQFLLRLGRSKIKKPQKCSILKTIIAFTAFKPRKTLTSILFLTTNSKLHGIYANLLNFNRVTLIETLTRTNRPGFSSNWVWIIKIYTFENTIYVWEMQILHMFNMLNLHKHYDIFYLTLSLKRNYIKSHISIGTNKDAFWSK